MRVHVDSGTREVPLGHAAPPARMKLAVLINLHARRGSVKAADLVRQYFPHARLVLTRSPEECSRWLAEELAPRPPDVLLAGGGDGTITGLLNSLRRAGLKVPALGVLPLGTGNAWARVTGTPRAAVALERLARWGDRPLPLRLFQLVETEGQVAPFAGTGWDAEMVQDFKDQLNTVPDGPLRQAQSGLRGYLTAMFTRTVPRHLKPDSTPRVRIYNVGEPALTVDAQGSLRPFPNGGDGALLYEGPASVLGAATTPELGYGLRAFPFAEAVPGKLNVRVCSASALTAVGNIRRIWTGHHPLPWMHDWFVDGARVEYDRDTPFQIAGDLAGPRRTVHFRLAPERVQLVNWRAMAEA